MSTDVSSISRRGVRTMVDRTTVLGFRAGDPDAVRAVYQAYGGLVFSVAHRVLGDASLAEEATQQAFMQAWRAARRFDVSRDLGPWLATIARRAAIDIHRREKIRVHRSIEDLAGGDLAVLTAADGTEREIDAGLVRSAVDGLPPGERDVVRLQHLDGFTHTEIAARLRIPIGTVKSRSSRAHGRLAASLGVLREAG